MATAASVDTRVRVLRLEKAMAIVWRARELCSVVGRRPDLIADLWEDALRMRVVSSAGFRSAIERRCRGAKGELCLALAYLICWGCGVEIYFRISCPVGTRVKAIGSCEASKLVDWNILWVYAASKLSMKEMTPCIRVENWEKSLVASNLRWKL